VRIVLFGVRAGLGFGLGEPVGRWLPTEEKTYSPETVDPIDLIQDGKSNQVEEILGCRIFGSRPDTLIHVDNDMVLLDVKADRDTDGKRVIVVEKSFASHRVRRSIHLIHQ